MFVLSKYCLLYHLDYLIKPVQILRELNIMSFLSSALHLEQRWVRISFLNWMTYHFCHPKGKLLKFDVQFFEIISVLSMSLLKL